MGVALTNRGPTRLRLQHALRRTQWSRRVFFGKVDAGHCLNDRFAADPHRGDLWSTQVPVWTNIDLSASDKVRALHEWWVAHRGPSGVPDRRDFDPTAFVRLLPNMMITDVEPAPFRIRYRLVGTKVADVLNIDFTGRYLDELADGASNTPWEDYYANSYATRQPVMGSVTELTIAGDTFTFEFGVFPVTVGGDEIRQFLSVEDYFGFNLTSAELVPWRFRSGAV
jgi:hypothetical protein